MYEALQVLVRKPGQSEKGLPEEVTIETKENGVLIVSSVDGKFETDISILDAFYDIKEEVTSQNLPIVTIKALDEIIGLFDAYASSPMPLLGLQVKNKLVGLKGTVNKASGNTLGVHSILGRKIS